MSIPSHSQLTSGFFEIHSTKPTPRDRETITYLKVEPEFLQNNSHSESKLWEKYYDTDDYVLLKRDMYLYSIQCDEEKTWVLEKGHDHSDDTLVFKRITEEDEIVKCVNAVFSEEKRSKELKLVQDCELYLFSILFLNVSRFKISTHISVEVSDWDYRGKTGVYANLTVRGQFDERYIEFGNISTIPSRYLACTFSTCPERFKFLPQETQKFFEKLKPNLVYYEKDSHPFSEFHETIEECPSLEGVHTVTSDDSE